MSLRSKVVIESNLKPSQFGKPATVNDDNEDFEDVYENPLEKLKPLQPRLNTNGIGINRGDKNNHQELPRNEPETMEFSNPSKIVTMITNDREANSSSIDPAGRNRDELGNKINAVQLNNNRNSNNSGFVNEGFDGIIINSSVAEEKSSDNITGSNRKNEKIVDVENPADSNRTSGDNGKNDRLPDDVEEDKPDISFRTVADVVRNIKSLDVNRYATKKTIAQGMLDIALLTANASQLKYILQIGKQHEFYILMLSLICVSIGLQLIHGVVCILLGSSLNINKQQDQKKANIWNNICLILMMLTVAVNAVISSFDMRTTSALVTSNVTGGAAITRLPSGGR